MSKIKQIPVKTGFLYRGNTIIANFEQKKVKLVKDETYVIAKIIPNSHVELTLKKPGASISFNISAAEYGKYIIPGRSSFQDTDPYLEN